VQSGAGFCSPLMENVLQSTGSGTAGGTTAGLIYTSVSSLSGKAIRIGFFIEVQWTSGGGWGTPSAVQLFGPGVKKPCDIVQGPFFTNGTSQAITPTSTINQIGISASSVVQVTPTTATTWTVRSLLKRGASILQTLTKQDYNASGSGDMVGSFGHAWLDSPTTTSSTTYSIGISGSAGVNLAGDSIMVWEVMGALEPATESGVSALPQAA
jgi:hypothetical protein